MWGEPYIDCQTLALAIEQDLERDREPDFRTRLLVRDARQRFDPTGELGGLLSWLATSPVGQQIRTILNEDLGQTGFPAIRRRLVDSIDLTRLSRIFDLLGRAIHGPVEVHIAGSIPTLIKGLTARPTADIDFVDEVPEEIRRQRAVLRKIETDSVSSWVMSSPTISRLTGRTAGSGSEISAASVFMSSMSTTSSSASSRASTKSTRTTWACWLLNWTR